MEVLAEQPPIGERQRRSFDTLASVRMLQYDLEHFGQVLPETRERVCDEELSLLTEGIDRAARTEFVLRRGAGGDLQYFRGGQWRSYMAMLLTGREVARTEAAADYRKQFLFDAAIEDLYHGTRMRQLRPGEQHVWHSPYPYDAEQRYGSAFLRNNGRSPDRKMGFIYRASCDEQGNVTLQSQTVDRSDDEAFGRVLAAAGRDPSAPMDTLVSVYDAELERKHGGHFYAGRRDAEWRENAWHTILAQRDLIEYFIRELETIAGRSLSEPALRQVVESHMYGVWAAFKKRLDGAATSSVRETSMLDIPGADQALLYQIQVRQEVRTAFTEFVSSDHVMVGCGGAISILRGSDMLNSPEDVFNAIFGGKEDDGPDGKGPLVFKCKNGHWNRRPLGKLITQCRVHGCKDSVGC